MDLWKWPVTNGIATLTGRYFLPCDNKGWHQELNIYVKPSPEPSHTGVLSSGHKCSQLGWLTQGPAGMLLYLALQHWDHMQVGIGLCTVPGFFLWLLRLYLVLVLSPWHFANQANFPVPLLSCFEGPGLNSDRIRSLVSLPTAPRPLFNLWQWLFIFKKTLYQHNIVYSSGEKYINDATKAFVELKM